MKLVPGFVVPIGGLSPESALLLERGLAEARMGKVRPVPAHIYKPKKKQKPKS